ncbi:VOC family protein [Parasporobacterium paucivorans]|uniref:Glyoxalase superfamily enzyme, possibly 3-demethylubiquinone-9 3-methyltransferase n=1 Tax=Parasporobacterium paucivorans DSM 15970 TaxID=1122934 RepID=A0A1M6EM82_9FIRM|nr:VOC family protein [Parasporobacterium paucivorans]SHI86553.1 Glyoxalase superfamily enzyme, possibly 3-demethylubiquinone-9 3-methyltransferase [Parasporobacterium paucivorans DSM 15970]
MQKIVPHLWYDKDAREAALFYISMFEQSRLDTVKIIKNTPSGDSEIVRFELAGQEFVAISAGPYFKFNPSISFMVACSTEEEVNKKWKMLSEGGTELMALGEYPFNKRYGWIQDRYGLSWQLMLVDEGQEVQKITPNLLFSKDSCGKAEEAVRYYAEVFKNSEIGMISRYAEREAKSAKAKVNYAAFKLDGVSFSAMDNGYDVDYTFNEAFSLIINCRDQKEIDYFWEKLSAVSEAEQCGWVRDKFGVSWQIVPSNLDEILFEGSEDEVRRVTEALLKMKKLDLEALRKSHLTP